MTPGSLADCPERMALLDHRSQESRTPRVARPEKHGHPGVQNGGRGQGMAVFHAWRSRSSSWMDLRMPGMDGVEGCDGSVRRKASGTWRSVVTVSVFDSDRKKEVSRRSWAPSRARCTSRQDPRMHSKAPEYTIYYPPGDPASAGGAGEGSLHEASAAQPAEVPTELRNVAIALSVKALPCRSMTQCCSLKSGAFRPSP